MDPRGGWQSPLVPPPGEHGAAHTPSSLAADFSIAVESVSAARAYGQRRVAAAQQNAGNAACLDALSTQVSNALSTERGVVTVAMIRAAWWMWHAHSVHGVVGRRGPRG